MCSLQASGGVVDRWRVSVVRWTTVSPQSPEMPPEAVFAQRPNVVLREVAGERLLIPIRREVADLRAVFVVTGIGAFIWELLDGARSLQTIVAAIVERYDVGVDEARADLFAFVERLSAAGIAERRA